MEIYRAFESFPRLQTVKKTWGYEIWFFNTDELCMKLLVIYPGWTCSYHEHPRKYEIFYVLDSDDQGRIHLTVDGEQKPMNPGDHAVIERNTPHEFTVLGDKPGALLEFSTEHRDDDSERHTISRLLSLGQKGHAFMGELKGFNDAKILLVGDLMWDIYWSGKTRGLSPEAPVPNIYPDSMWGNARPGGVGNVVSNVLSLGGQAVAVGCVGHDLFGTSLLKMMESQGCQMAFTIQSGKIPTTTKIRIMDGPHHHCRVNFENQEDYPGPLADRVLEHYKEAVEMEKPHIIYFGDYDKGLLCPRFLAAAIALANEKGIPTIVDPKLAHAWDYKGVSIYKPNINRLSTSLGKPLDVESDMDWAAKVINDRLHPEFILITRGAHGMSLYGESTGKKHIPGKTVQVWELSGAGDTVGAVLALCLASDIAMERAAEIANIAGGLVVQKPGTATLTPSELAEAIE